MKTLEEFYDECRMKMKKNTLIQIVNSANRELCGRGWTGTRGAYLCALQDEFKERDCGYEVGNKKPTCVVIKNRKQVLLYIYSEVLTPEEQKKISDVTFPIFEACETTLEYVNYYNSLVFRRNCLDEQIDFKAVTEKLKQLGEFPSEIDRCHTIFSYDETSYKPNGTDVFCPVIR